MNFRKEIYIRILIPALMIYALAALFITGGRLARAEQELEQVRAQREALEQQNAELCYALEHAGDPEVIAQQARQRLGLVMPGDKVIYDTGD